MLRIFVKILITAGLLTALTQGIDLAQFVKAIRNVGWGSIVAGIGILFSLSFVQAFRWQFILNGLGTNIVYLTTWLTVLIGFFFSQLLPTSIGGDIARVWKLRQAGISMSCALNSVLLDRITALIAAVLITAGGASLLFSLFPGTAIRYLVIGAVSATVAGYLLLIVVESSPKASATLNGLDSTRAGRYLMGIVNDAKAILLNPKVLFATVALSCTIQIAVSSTVWLIATDVGARIDLLTCNVLVPLVILVSMVPVSIAGWGVREGAMIVALGAAGVDHTTALATSILFGLMLAATGIPGCFIWLFGRRQPHTKLPL